MTTESSIGRAVLHTARRDVLIRRVRWFVAATIAYNVVEAVVAITAGAEASSTALIRFGLDSIIEVSSAAAVAWQFSAPDHATRDAREQRALRIIAVSFFALAAYVSVESVRALLGDADARHSPVGLVLAALSLLIMPLLSTAQRRAGRELGSASAVADSKQTLLCTYLSAVLLVGLGVNSLFSWSWADPVAALAIAAVAIQEGLQAWRGDGCCAPNTSLLATITTGEPVDGDEGVDDCCTPAQLSTGSALASMIPTTSAGLTISVRPPAAHAGALNGGTTDEPAPSASGFRPTAHRCTDGCCSTRQP